MVLYSPEAVQLALQIHHARGLAQGGTKSKESIYYTLQAEVRSGYWFSLPKQGSSGVV